MIQNSPRERFLTLARCEEEEIELLEAVLLIAQEEYPSLRIHEEIDLVDSFARRLGPYVAGAEDFFNAVYALNRLLFDDLGFRGNTDDYGDPDNSMMNRVLARRTGIPITLSILYMEVAARLGFRVLGVPFPGHFIVRFEDEWGHTYIDPFYKGRILLRSDLQRRLNRVLGPDAVMRPAYLQPARKKQILTRVLHNLKRVYLGKRDFARALSVTERIVILNPSAAGERRDRGILYSQTGRRGAAIADLRGYLAEHPEATDAPRIRSLLNTLLQKRTAEGG